MHKICTNILWYLYSRNIDEIRPHWNTYLACWMIYFLLTVLLFSIAEYFHSLFVFWLALRAHQIWHNSYKYPAILHNKTSNKIYVQDSLMPLKCYKYNKQSFKALKKVCRNNLSTISWSSKINHLSKVWKAGTSEMSYRRKD